MHVSVVYLMWGQILVAMILRRSISQVSRTLVQWCIMHCGMPISSVPAPNVSLSLNTDDTVYQGTELVITCTVTVDSAVDTEYDINMTWTSDPAGVMNGTYITISDITDSEQEYNSTVTISPVNTTDSATYTCTAGVITTDSNDLIISSMENSDSEKITVEGKLI